MCETTLDMGNYSKMFLLKSILSPTNVDLKIVVGISKNIIGIQGT